MFCEECGAKLKQGSNFCEECGAKVENVQKKEPKKTKPLKTKTKVIIVAAVFIIVVLVFTFITLNNKFKPENVALDYFKAVTSGDVNKLYSYLNVPDKDLTSKKVFKEIVDTDNDEKVINYNVTNTKISSDGMEATVNIRYVTDSSNSETMNIKLVKNKSNKMLIFDNWQVAAEADLIADYQIKVMKDAKVTVAGVKLDDYLDKESSDDNYDVYEIPAMFNVSYPVTVTYPMGITTNTEVKPSSYLNVKTLSFDLNDITKKDKEKLEKAVISNMQYIYDSALADKSFDDIKDKLGDSESLEEQYNDFKQLLEKRASDLKEITFTEVKLNRVDVNDEGIEVSFKIEYDYKKDKTNDSSAYSSLVFTYDDEYKVIDFNNLKTYF